MKRGFDLCTGRDYRGQKWYTQVPAGVARTGMFVRLVGGVFILVDRVEQAGQVPVCASYSTAVQILDSVWEGRCRD